jgi:hypothetical protein
MYTIEVFTGEGIDTDVVRWYIFGKTGMMPAIYDHGTHLVTDQKLTRDAQGDIRQRRCNRLRGEYSDSFASNGPMHECHLIG